MSIRYYPFYRGSLVFYDLTEYALHPPASQRKHRCHHLLLQFLEISLLEGLEAFEQLEHSCFCLLPQCCFHSFTRFHVQGVSSLLFTLLGFADEDTPVLFICLQLFHTPLLG